VSDLELPSFSSVRNPRSRRLRRCCECSGPILIGEVYERTSGVWSGSFEEFIVCAQCVEWRNSLFLQEWPLGNLAEYAREMFDAPTLAAWEDYLRERRASRHEAAAQQ
jgi:hypothetical protein